jgi:methylated-DNA-[protein]-cysteine S-methyltransferase
VEFVLKGTAFQKKVWREILKIPYGQTLSYGQLAINIGHPNSYRAIGATCGANPLPIIIPCHRVISKTGALIGYNGGLDRKKWLLDFEKSQTPVYIKKK